MCEDVLCFSAPRYGYGCKIDVSILGIFSPPFSFPLTPVHILHVWKRGKHKVKSKTKHSEMWSKQMTLSTWSSPTGWREVFFFFLPVAARGTAAKSVMPRVPTWNTVHDKSFCCLIAYVSAVDNYYYSLQCSGALNCSLSSARFILILTTELRSRLFKKRTDKL